MAAVYILYSSDLDKFYIGSCADLVERVYHHLSKYFAGAFTSKANDWIVYFCLDNLSYPQARKIERHIKKMKSRRYIESLKSHDEISRKLIKLYQ